MSAAEAAVRHLKAAREEFIRERSQLDRHIHELDIMIARFEGGEPGSGAPASTRPAMKDEATQMVPRLIVTAPDDDHRPSMREAILAVLSQADRNTMASSAIEDHLSDRYGWAGASVRSQLLKMLNANDLVRPARGIYRLARSTDAEGPATAGPSDGATTTGRGGEGTDAQPSNDRDHDTDLFAGENRDHGRGASVVGG